MNWYKKAAIAISKKDMKTLRGLISKIMKGQRDWTDEELQVQQNHPQLVEDLLQKKYIETA